MPSALGAGGVSTPVAAVPAPRLPTPAVACTWRLRLAVVPGMSMAVDALSSTAPGQSAVPLTEDPPRLLAYTVRIENASGRSAPPSLPAVAAAGAAPAPVLDLRFTAMRNGARLGWQRTTDAGTVALTRRQLQPAAPPSTFPQSSVSTAAKPPKPRHIPRSPGQTLRRGSPGGAAPSPVRLLASPPGTPDPGGTLDVTAPPGKALTYVAERVRSVSIGGTTLDLHSEPSPPITATLTDTFPPAVPAGLVAVDGSAPATLTAPAQPAVDLSWEPVVDPNLAGYLIERADATTAPPQWHQLNQTPVSEPAFHDRSAPPGTGLRYRVFALDTHGNRSAAAPETTIRLPPR